MYAITNPSGTFACATAIVLIAIATGGCQRETAAPEPAVAASEPAVATPEPAVAAPEPAVAAPAAPGSKAFVSDDDQMVEALRAGMVKLHGPMDMTAVSIRRIDDWAWLVGQPHAPGVRDDEDHNDPVSALMRKVKGAWTLAEIACSEVDNAECLGSPEFAKRFGARHPGMPKEILPTVAE